MDEKLIIVGGGPSGLTLAWLLGRAGKKCVLLERQSQIGGCHSVRRVGGEFSEHGPRVYSSTYTTFTRMLKDMGTSFDAIFTPYKFSVSNIGGKTTSNMTFWELYQLTNAYLWNAIWPSYYRNLSMKDFVKDFTPSTIDYLDRLCRLTDGAGLDNYSVYKFLQLVNQHFALHKFYQPKQPNDLGLFAVWKRELDKLGVEVRLNSEINHVLLSPNGDSTVGVQLTDGSQISGSTVILAIPPKPLAKIMNATLTQFPEKPDAANLGFKPNSGAKFDIWATDNSYVDYITITYHWKNAIPLKSVWGFPSTAWGIAHVVLSDYFISDKPETLITVGITRVDSPNADGITARNAGDDILINEAFQQLQTVYPDLPKWDSAHIGSRIGQETAYVQGSSDSSFLPFAASGIRGLYNVGTQNGKSQYAFTSTETAVVNAHALAHELEPSLHSEYPIIVPWTLNQLLGVVILLIITIIIALKTYWSYTKKLIESNKDIIIL
jgi:hypothetical protein